MRIVNTDPHTDTLSHEGTVYKALHGVFEVPEHVGQALIGFPHWLREHEAEHLKATAALTAAVDPGQMAARLAMLEMTQQQAAAEAAARIAALEAENAALRGATPSPAAAQDAPVPADSTADQPPADAAEPEMSRQQKAAATRAANKAAAEAAAATQA